MYAPRTVPATVAKPPVITEFISDLDKINNDSVLIIVIIERMPCHGGQERSN